ncbi:hypothetical protein GCM10012290_17640 [Halolactibacillus alkaliphilus]|uniref:RNase H type-1 domain-containing protein n=1 Tax=Halolactibacillus alkaliphilus TaxID=442899 RepID=A0A511X2E9_9BACI|nr:reverse transcriptase-like protein [Halolactibacillus alkaliphilus]GEN57119.1 hypothetical protein HAL01_15830 [Halolactibacillus alkaliphilus]GGN72060.1 hypothetical protein GCM10012290_17640 [Halolactibacillus alkaliphilus]SFO87787.1 ribonuclease HI [Halolactibacillus alkaliphilus]
MKYQLSYCYQLGKQKLYLTSNWVPLDVAILFMERFLSHKDYQDVQAIDETDHVYTMKQLRQEKENMAMSIHSISLYFDASFNQLSKLSGLGIVWTYRQGKRMVEKRKNLSSALPKTVNEAEYYSLFHGLEQLKQLEIAPQKIAIYGDSLVVINQLKGEWPIMDPTLSKWADDVESLLNTLNLQAVYHHIDRQHNKSADRLSKQAMAHIAIDSSNEIESED